MHFVQAEFKQFYYCYPQTSYITRIITVIGLNFLCSFDETTASDDKFICVVGKIVQ